MLSRRDMLKLSAMVLLSACVNTNELQSTSPTSTPEIPEATVATRDTAVAQTLQPMPSTPTSTYELEPGETWFAIGASGGDMPYEEIGIAVDDPHIETYTNEDGEVIERGVARLWLGSAQHPAARSRPVQVGEVIEFEGYRIRILNVRSNALHIAISRLDEQQAFSTPTFSIYNTELGEELLSWPNGRHLSYGSIWIAFSNPRVEDSGTTTEVVVVNLSLWSDQTPAELSSIVRVGDIAEFEGYRIRVLAISSYSVLVAIAELSELSAEPGIETP